MNRILRTCVLNRNIYKSFEISKRSAGHSKWQNIKHIKAETDHARSILFAQLRKKIREAVFEGGGSIKPTINLKLARVIEICKKSNMPMSTINNILEKVNMCKDKTQSSVIQIQGPKNCIMVLKIVTDNLVQTKIHVNTVLKKINAKAAQGVINSSFEHNGIIITEAKHTLETAMEDAINIGATDIEEIQEDENKYYKFKCEPELLIKITSQLKNSDYNIIDAKEEFIPLFCIKLNDEDLKVVESAQEKLLKLEEIEEIYDNVERDNL
ncbi:hypothetical protein M0802_007507 [Mischocyttarus mexicanus]|nr:hypothetical protein M0802_007507 [Mischocyttarus mexicanus]